MYSEVSDITEYQCFFHYPDNERVGYKRIVVLPSGTNGNSIKVAKYLGSTDFKMSLHYYIDSDGTIANCLDEIYPAYACGSKKLDSESITIMIESPKSISPLNKNYISEEIRVYDITDEASKAFVKLCNEIRSRHNITTDLVLYNYSLRTGKCEIDNPIFKPLIDSIGEKMVSCKEYL